MATRFFTAAGAIFLLATGVLIAQPQQRTPPPPGNRVEVRDGDTVVIEDDARVRIVRRRNGNVRTVFHPTERWAIVLVDWATAKGGPDGRVDQTYSYTSLTNEWPMEERWEGAATIEDYMIAGEGTIAGMGLIVPRGLVQFLPTFNPELFIDSSATAMLLFRGSGRGGSGMSFDAAEQREIQQTRQQAMRQTSLPPGASISTSFGIAGNTSGVAVSDIAGGAPPSGAVRVGGNISPPRKVVDVQPVMPEVALQAGVRGVVIVEITIDGDGTVKDAKILRSIPLLDEAALNAVRQWRYTPTTLGGQPVPVLMTVTVDFR